MGKRSAVETESITPDPMSDLLAIEQQLEREWWWLQGALNAVAELRVARVSGDPAHFRELQAQAHEIGRRRVLIAIKIAELEPERKQH